MPALPRDRDNSADRAFVNNQANRIDTAVIISKPNYNKKPGMGTLAKAAGYNLEKKPHQMEKPSQM